MKSFKNAFWGVALILVGVILGTNAMGITKIDLFFDGWWTLFIIVPCLFGLCSPKEEKTGNLIGLGIGIVLLSCSQGWLDFGLVRKLLVPAILVIIGCSILFKNTISSKCREKIQELNDARSGGEGKTHCAIFSGSKLNYAGQPFDGVDLEAIFGGIECNLRGAGLPQEVLINATSIFGGIDIFIPENVNVKVNSTSIFGGVSNHKGQGENPAWPTVYVNATCLFGGVDIK